MRPFEAKRLRPLETALQALNKEIDESIESMARYHENRRKERSSRIVTTRQAILLLQMEEFQLLQGDFNTDEMVYVDLGSAVGVNGRLDKSLVTGIEESKLRIASILQCHLEESIREVVKADKQIIKVTLVPSKFPGVVVFYETRLTGKEPCKIETIRQVTRRSRLVCQMPDSGGS